MTSEDFFAFMDGPRIEMSDYSDARGACTPQEVSNIAVAGQLEWEVPRIVLEHCPRAASQFPEAEDQ